MARSIAISCGDPQGIGPEVLRKALASGKLPKEFDYRVFDAPGRAGFDALEQAADAVMAGRCAALVTGPVSKKRVADAGIPFQGHTEYLAAKAGARDVVMTFVGDRFIVGLVTTHVPIKRVASLITQERVTRTIEVLRDGLRTYFGKANPTIAVCGLNPHAGEEGIFGREEIEAIQPACEATGAAGPFSPDTIFRRQEFDAFVAMYHDQALPLVKTVDPNAVNVTLGLPFIRTSPDHGTAFDIAGKGIADPEPMIHAIQLACRMASATLF